MMDWERIEDHWRKANLRYQADQRLLEILEEAGVSRTTLARAWYEAFAFGVPFTDALCGGGFVDEQTIVDILADKFGLSIGDPQNHRAACGMPFSLAVRAGAIRLMDGSIAIMPRGQRLPRLLEALEESYRGSSIALVTRQNLIAIALQDNKRQVAYEATYHLADTKPLFSAERLLSWKQALFGISFMALIVFAAHAWPHLLLFAVQILGCAAFMCLAWARLVACTVSVASERGALRAKDHELPVYTILVPLFEEEAAIGGLLASLQALSYPCVKLDVKLLVEEEDEITRNALKGIPVPGWVDIMLIPKGEVRTKPRALNVGLSVARGDYLVVYDAEDRPHPMQLRHALERFETTSLRTAVVQARLSIDRSQRGFLPSQFRLEYAGLFAVVLPALAAFRLPLPLGGTSNHFRTHILRKIGGWDPFNVTEDADIGLRLHRVGYRAEVISSETEEEAPTHVGAWIKQRTRWFKGWIITILVHTREPSILIRDCGVVGSAMFVLLTGGIVASALVEPICLMFVFVSIARNEFLQPDASLAEALLQGFFLVSLILGHIAAALTCVMGCARIGYSPGVKSLLGIPFYWLLASFSAWRAFWKAFVEPYRWEKTAHVLARMPDTARPQNVSLRRKLARAPKKRSPIGDWAKLH